VDISVSDVDLRKSVLIEELKKRVRVAKTIDEIKTLRQRLANLTEEIGENEEFVAVVESARKKQIRLVQPLLAPAAEQFSTLMEDLRSKTTPLLKEVIKGLDFESIQPEVLKQFAVHPDVVGDKLDKVQEEALRERLFKRELNRRIRNLRARVSRQFQKREDYLDEARKVINDSLELKTERDDEGHIVKRPRLTKVERAFLEAIRENSKTRIPNLYRVIRRAGDRAEWHWVKTDEDDDVAEPSPTGDEKKVDAVPKKTGAEPVRSELEAPARPEPTPSTEVLDSKAPGVFNRLIEGIRLVLYAVIAYLAIPTILAILFNVIPSTTVAGGIVASVLASPTFLTLLAIPISAYLIKLITERNAVMRVEVDLNTEEREARAGRAPPEGLTTTQAVDWLAQEVYKDSPRGDLETLVHDANTLGIPGLKLGAKKVKGFTYHDHIPTLGYDPSVDQIIDRIAIQFGIEKSHLLQLARAVNIGTSEADIPKWHSVYDALKRSNKENYFAMQMQKDHGFIAHLVAAARAPWLWKIPMLVYAIFIMGPHLLVQFFYGFFLRAVGYEWVAGKRDFLGHERALVNIYLTEQLQFTEKRIKIIHSGFFARHLK